MRFAFPFFALFAFACTTSSLPPVECGDDGRYSEDEVGRYCSYIVVRGGFMCPAALEYGVPVGTGMVCTDVRDATPESIPPVACAGLSDPRCGTATLACAEPTRPPAFADCAPAFPEPRGIVGPWDRDMLDVDTDAVLEDGDTLKVGTRPDGSLGASVAMRPRSSFVCHQVDASVIASDGTEVTTVIGQVLTSGDPGRYVFTFGVPGVGPATVRLSYLDLSGSVFVWERELELACE